MGMDSSAANVGELGDFVPMTDEQLNDLVDRWHAGEGSDRPLHEFLGWTKEEYMVWVRTGARTR